MKRIVFLLLCLAVVGSGCTWGTPKRAKTQLEIREFQTRTFETTDSKMVIKALLNVLQDEGFTIKSADADLGFISATKEIDLGNRSAPIFWGINTHSKDSPRWKKLRVIDATGNVTAYGKETKVRVSFQERILDNQGDVMSVKQIEDPQFYQNFFSKVDKGIFLQKENL